MKVEFRINPESSSETLNTLFTRSWEGHVEREFGPLLDAALLYVVGFVGQEVVAFAKVAWDGGEHGFLLDPTVLPEFRRRGIGKRLVELCAEEAKARGIVWLHVDFEPHLRQFYAACGFRYSEAGLMNLTGTQ